ncbi:MAG: TrmB family transcriptional regulator [Candidatus Eisenbacteria sp.]|nr:TrmB family transcriptional regulator [Candidatus Eisenbacteria bacterium]
MPSSHLHTLSKMGLSVNEAKVYLALLKRNTSAVSDLVPGSGVPQKMIYYTLQKLLDKGLCALIPGKVKRYKPADPRAAIGNFVERAQHQLALSQTMLLELQKHYETGQNQTSTQECIEILRNTALIADKMLAMEREATKEVLSFNKAPYAMSKRNEEELAGLKRGVTYRSIYEISEASKLVSRSVIEMYSDAGEQVRIAQNLPMKMMIFDGNALLFSLEEPTAATGKFSAAIIRRSNLISGLQELFDIHWSQALTLDEFKFEYRDSISLEDNQQRS